jgi:hypothetical protein
MRLSDTHMKWIMIVSGALTCSMIYALIAPEAASRSTFGTAIEGSSGDVVVRNWGALITLLGAMLIYGPLHPPVRSFVLVIAAASKVVFIGLVLSHGTAFLGYQAGTAIAIDSVWMLLFAWYLLTSRHAAP